MVQQATDSVRVNRSPRPTSQALPTVGMRGGLGKTLLIAFLLLTIVPLSLLAFLTYTQIQRETRQKIVASLETTVALKEAHLMDWVRGYERELGLLAAVLDREADQTSEQAVAQMAALQTVDPALSALILMDLDTGEVLASTDPARAGTSIPKPLAGDDIGLIVAPAPPGSSQPLLAVSYAWDNRLLIGLLSWDALRQVVTASDGPEEEGITYLVSDDGWMLSGEGLTFLSSEQRKSASQAVVETLQGQSGSAAYADLEGVPVFGAYRWNPELKIGILAEQSQLRALSAGNTLTALVVGATLAVALVTSALAAVVSRRVTRPIVQLTETAAWMARGDLDQRVAIARQDEIGVLARAFNRMAAELRVLYDDLEAKVAERTSQLEEANERTRYYLMQLATSAEVARVASSIRDLDVLLTTVVRLISRAFELYHACIYLLDDSGQWAVAATSTRQVGGEDSHYLPERVEVGGATLVGRVVADGRSRVVRAGPSGGQEDDTDTVGTLQPPVVCELAVPLQVQEQMLGVLHLQSCRPDDCGENEQVVFQSLADQISIAIENARAYTVERETVKRLRELDRIQSQFLTNMSHALRTPLNSVIGFSRVLLKELDGPLNEMQRADLTAIYDSGRQLLGLINDMLELSRLELGVAPFSPSEVDLAEILEGVMATTRALARGKPIKVYEEVPADLPILRTDGQRVRQVILALLSNAVKFTDRGSIRVCVTSDDGHVTISVRDTGVGIPREERERVFSDARYRSTGSGTDGGAGRDEGVAGFGLAISKRVVEKLGGRIWVESVEGVGSTFTFSLPIGPAEEEASSGGKRHVEEA